MKYSLNIDLHRPNTSLAPSPRQSLPDLPEFGWLGEFLLFVWWNVGFFSGGRVKYIFGFHIFIWQNTKHKTNKTSHKTLEFEVHVSKYSPPTKKNLAMAHSMQLPAVRQVAQPKPHWAQWPATVTPKSWKWKKDGKKMAPLRSFFGRQLVKPQGDFLEVPNELKNIQQKKNHGTKRQRLIPSFTKNLWEKNQWLPSSHPFLSGWFPTLRIQKNSLEVEHSYSAPFLNGRMARSHETLRKFGILSWRAVKKIQGCDPNHNQKKKSSGWWLNQPIWKICSSNWKSSPIFGVKI